MRTPLLAISFTREAALIMRGSCSCLQAAEQPEKLADQHSTSHNGSIGSRRLMPKQILDHYDWFESIISSRVITNCLQNIHENS
jgi:hypothetical protein